MHSLSKEPELTFGMRIVRTPGSLQARNPVLAGVRTLRIVAFQRSRRAAALHVQAMFPAKERRAVSSRKRFSPPGPLRFRAQCPAAHPTSPRRCVGVRTVRMRTRAPDAELTVRPPLIPTRNTAIGGRSDCELQTLGDA